MELSDSIAFENPLAAAAAATPAMEIGAAAGDDK